MMERQKVCQQPGRPGDRSACFLPTAFPALPEQACKLAALAAARIRSASELAGEGAVLEGGEERVCSSLRVSSVERAYRYPLNTSSILPLQVKRRKVHNQRSKILLIQLRN